MNEIITNILDLFYNFKGNYKNYSTRNGVNEINRYNAFGSYDNIYEEECKESYKKHINNLTKDKIKYAILKENIKIYYIGSSLNNNNNNYNNNNNKIINKRPSLNNNNNNNKNNNIIDRRSIFATEFILNFILYLVKNDIFNKYKESIGNYFNNNNISNNNYTKNIFDIHSFLDFFRFNSDLITFIEKVTNSIEVYKKTSRRIKFFNFPIKINFIDKKYKKFIVINEYTEKTFYNNYGGSYVDGYIMKEKYSKKETIETYNRFNILKLNYTLLKGILDGKTNKENIKLLYSIVNIRNSNNKSFYNIDDNFDFSIQTDVNNLFKQFTKEIITLPGFGNNYIASLKSFESYI